MSVQLLGIKASMRTDRQGKILPLGPVTVIKTLTKKWLIHFQHEQLFIPKHGLLRGEIATDVTEVCKCNEGLCLLGLC